MKWRQVVTDASEQQRWYDATFRRMGQVWQTPAAEWDAHMERMGLPVERRVHLLDIGCGDGAFLFHLAEKQAVTAMGIDLSHQAIDWAQQKRDRLGVGIHFICDDAPRWMERLVGESWDWVVSMGSLEHVIEFEATLEQVRRLLKSQGHFYFYVPSELWLHEDQPTERTGAVEEWIEALSAQGLHVDEFWALGDCLALKGRRS